MNMAGDPEITSVRYDDESVDVEGPKVGPTISVKKSPYSPEDQKYLEETVGATLAGVRNSFSHAGVHFLDDAKVFDEMVMTKRFRTEQIKAFRRYVDVPGLIALSPEMGSAQDYVRFLDNNRKIFGQLATSISDSVRPEFARQDEEFRRQDEREGKVGEWRFGLGEMRPDPVSVRDRFNRKGKLGNVVRSWERTDLSGLLKPANYREYAMLQAQSPRLMDLRGQTMLRSGTSDRLVGANGLIASVHGYAENWGNERGVHFDQRDPKDRLYHVDSRVRPVLMG